MAEAPQGILRWFERLIGVLDTVFQVRQQTINEMSVVTLGSQFNL